MLDAQVGLRVARMRLEALPVREFDLPRPRDQEITASAEFGRIKRDVLYLVRDGEARAPTVPMQAGL